MDMDMYGNSSYRSSGLLWLFSLKMYSEVAMFVPFPCGENGIRQRQEKLSIKKA